MTVDVVLTVVAVRSRGSRGGVIFVGETESIPEIRYVVVCDYTLVRTASIVDIGQSWRVVGEVERRATKNQRVRWEPHVIATTAEIQRAAGHNIVRWIARNKDIKGVGPVRAQKLWTRHGEALVEILQARDVDALMADVSEEAATALCDAFGRYHAAVALLWLDKVGIEPRIGQKIVEYYGASAQERIEANPYCLISFAAKWLEVDKLAKDRFGFADRLDDPRRVEAATEDSLYAGMSSGHTCARRPDLRRELVRRVGARVADRALQAPLDSTQVKVIEDLYQAYGMHAVESFIAGRLLEMAAGEKADQPEMFGRDQRSEAQVLEAIERYDQQNAFPLVDQQRRAVVNSAAHGFSLILGGAGTGKTTVLKALYAALESGSEAGGTSSLWVIQLALSGRAAQRMKEASGRESMTIAAFLHKFARSDADRELLNARAESLVVVLDEASMVDVLLMYRLLRCIPKGAKFILVGDPSQLPPIGPGLVLHALVRHPLVAQVELTEVKRQDEASGIPMVAKAIRAHQLPVWSKYTGKGSGVSFIECEDADIAGTVAKVYEELGGDGSHYDVITLATTKTRTGGVADINHQLHARFSDSNSRVHYRDSQHGILQARAESNTVRHLPLCVGDLVMYLENNYDSGLRNGVLGRISAAFDVGDADSFCFAAEFEGQIHRFKAAELKAVAHAYAMTIHKAQGSQFGRVIVAISHKGRRMIDQTLIYTALTRGVEQVVFVGCQATAEKAILGPASVDRRQVALPRILQATASSKSLH